MPFLAKLENRSDKEQLWTPIILPKNKKVKTEFVPNYFLLNQATLLFTAVTSELWLTWLSCKTHQYIWQILSQSRHREKYQFVWVSTGTEESSPWLASSCCSSSHQRKVVLSIWWKTSTGTLWKLTKAPLCLLTSLGIKGWKIRQWNIYGLISIVWMTSSEENVIHGIVKTEGERKKKKEASHCIIKKAWSNKWNIKQPGRISA